MKRKKILLVDDRREAKAFVLRLQHAFDVEVELIGHPDYGLGELLGDEQYLAAILGGGFEKPNPKTDIGLSSGPELYDHFRDMCPETMPNREVPVCFYCGDPREHAASASDEARRLPFFQKGDIGDWDLLVAWLIQAGVPTKKSGDQKQEPIRLVG